VRLLNRCRHRAAE